MLRDLESKREVEKRVKRVLLDADAIGKFPTPVDDIVAAAKLAYSNENPLDESVIKRMPAYLRAKIRTAIDKIQGAVDRRERVVHVNPNITHEGRRRFVVLHETTHAILPHQQDLVFADDDETLSPSVKHLFEQEANQGAAEMLFQLDTFRKDAASYKVSMGAAHFLAEKYGASVHATLRRFAETHRDPLAVVVFDPQPENAAGTVWRRREVIYSQAWEKQFGKPYWPALMSGQKYPFVVALTHPEIGEVRVQDRALNFTHINVESFSTPYRTFALLWAPVETKMIRSRRVVLTTKS